MFIDTYGVTIELTLNYDLTGNTGVNIEVKDPAGNVETRPVNISNTLSGIVEYVVAQGHFPTSGAYLLQVVADFGATKRVRSEVWAHRVEEL